MLKAWGSNVFALAHLHKLWADTLGYPIGVYREFIDNAHVYGRDIEYAKNAVQRPLSKMEWPLEDILKEANE
jgi:thymidylate synthase